MHFRFFYYSAELRHKKSENEKIIWRLWKWAGTVCNYGLPSFIMVRARREPQGTMVLISRNSSGLGYLQRFPAGFYVLFYIYDFSGALLGLHRYGGIRIAQGGHAVDHMVCGNADLV